MNRANKSDLRGILPQKMIDEHNRARASRPAAGEAEGGHRRDGDQRRSAETTSAIELHWCGERGAVLVLTLDGRMFSQHWYSNQQSVVRFPASVGLHELQITKLNGDPVKRVDVNVSAAKLSAVNVGHLYSHIVCEPQGRSQFSFEDGRSACSFLCCDAAAFLWSKLSSADNEITSAEILGQDIARILSQGMTKYTEQARCYIEAAGLEHTSIGEVMALCGSVWDGEVRGAEDGSFWGTLTEEESLHESLLQAVSAAYKDLAKRGGGGQQRSHPVFIGITRPPETLLLVILEEQQLYGVLDTHSRTVGSTQYPASWYCCGSLQKLSELLKATFFPLPADLHPEELGMYAMFELTVFSLGGSKTESSAGLNVSDELDPDSVLL